MASAVTQAHVSGHDLDHITNRWTIGFIRRTWILLCIGAAALPAVLVLLASSERSEPYSDERVELSLIHNNAKHSRHSTTESAVRALKAQLHAEVQKLQSISGPATKNSMHDLGGSRISDAILRSKIGGEHSAERGTKIHMEVTSMLGSTKSKERSADAAKIRKLEAELAKVKSSLSNRSPVRRTGLGGCEDDPNGCQTPVKDLDGDDPDEDRTKDSVLDQILRLPLVYHLALTLDHVFPDAFSNLTGGIVVAAARNSSHPVRLFDDDRLASVRPREAAPLPPQDRGPEYYPGGEFADRFRQPGTSERFLEGGFDDRTVAVGNTTKINITTSRSYLTGEANFRGVADDR